MVPQRGQLAGRTVAGYRLARLLGYGGASEVYLAERDGDEEREVAIKVLMPSSQLSAEARTNFQARFAREARAASRLRHPHILAVLAYGEENDVSFLVLPFISGGTLATRLAAARGGLPLAEAAGYLEQLAGALDFAHAQGVIHRDVKPTNILLDADRQLYLADFGIARLFDVSADGVENQPPTPLTVTGQVLGTPLYMAPEQLRSARVGPAADIYSLGIVLYQLVTGDVPFHAETPLALAVQHVHDPPPMPSTRRLDLPSAAEAAILKALAKSPDDRYTSAEEFARAFEAGLRGEWTADVVAFTSNLDPANTKPASPAHAPPLPPPLVATPKQYPTQALPYGTPDTPADPIARGPQRTARAIAVVAILLALLGVGVGAQVAGLDIIGAVRSAFTTTTTVVVIGGHYTTTPTPTPSTAACLRLSGFAGATSASAGAQFPDVRFPAASVSYLASTFQDGSYAFQLVSACTASSPATVRAFFAMNLPALGWSQSATYPYAGDPTRPCGDAYCWSKGSSPPRFVSLEQVTSEGSATTYDLRLGVGP